MKYLVIALVLLLGVGCSSMQRDYYENWEREPVLSAEQRYYWLRIADLYMELTPTQARQRLDAIGDEEKTTLQWYRYALLNQQLNNRAGWIRARDAFRYVIASESLSQELYGLTKLLLKYNQSLINWDARYSKVKMELKESEGMQRVLEEKIQAITNLEQNMSSRKEQPVEP
ncbi:hypothetical protein imdm_356 [gamma proteobacterium IMCC2047]|nr:hypothetical protein imdm_356 [gamma proteobacterium IMCC2047]